MSSPYTHILCPVDFSDVSRAALEWSLGFAGDIQGKVTVLHVVDTGILSMGNLVGVPDALDSLKTQAERKLADWKREMDLSKAEVRLVEGSPPDVIVETANGEGTDLLVMGAHGLSGFQRLLLGSVTEKVLHRARVPLLAIPAKESEGARGGFAAPRTILLAVDFGPEAQSVLRHGVWLAEHYGAALVAVHAVPVPYVVLNDRTIERLTPEQLAELEEGLVRERREELDSLLPESMGARSEIVVRIGSAFECLHEIGRDRDADLVVMGAGAHGEVGLGWLGSTCHKMVRSAARPVLIVR